MPWSTNNQNKSGVTDDELAAANDETEADILQGLAGLVADDLEIR